MVEDNKSSKLKVDRCNHKDLSVEKFKVMSKTKYLRKSSIH